MRLPRENLCFLIALCAMTFCAQFALAAGGLDVWGTEHSITSRTLTVRDETESKDSRSNSWSVIVESETADVIVLGQASLLGDKSNEIEIPFLVVVPEGGPVDSKATIIVMRGEQVIWTEVIEIHRTPNPADINLDGRVDAGDLTLLLSNWGRCVKRGECLADINGDGWVDGRDMSILVAAWHL